MIRMTFPAITTRQSFSEVLELFSDVDGTPFDLTGASVQVSIGRADDWLPWWGAMDYLSYYDSTWWGTTPILTLKTADGSITTALEAVGKYPFVFTPAQIASLCPGQYVVGANITRDGYTAMLILGNLPVIDGVVPQ